MDARIGAGMDCIGHAGAFRTHQQYVIGLEDEGGQGSGAFAGHQHDAFILRRHRRFECCPIGVADDLGLCSIIHARALQRPLRKGEAAGIDNVADSVQARSCAQDRAYISGDFGLIESDIHGASDKKGPAGKNLHRFACYGQSMAQAPAISVIMSVYNGARYLRAAVDSILAQSFADFEFLVVNDGSTDDSGAILRELAANDPRIRVIDRENRGLIASLNELVAAARAPLLARIDADDIAMPGRFAAQFAYLSAHPEIAILGTNTHELDEQGNLLHCDDFYPADPKEAVKILPDGPPVCHPSVMMRAELVRKVGGYHAAFRHAEDYDLWLRASLHGGIANLPDRLLLYRRSAEQVSLKYAVEQTRNAAIAWQCHRRRLAGKPELFDDVDRLPALDALDNVFGETGIADQVRLTMVKRLKYSDEMLKGGEFPLMIAQARSKSRFEGAWRTTLRLALAGRADRAAQLAQALVSRNLRAL